MEHRYGAVLLGHVLLGDPVPELGDDVIPVEVRFQQVESTPVDDLIVVGRTPDGARRQVSIGVRRAPKVTAGDAATARLLTSYLRVVTEHWGEVQAGRWRLALATADPNPAVKQVRELAVLARGQSGDAAFRDAVARPGRVGKLVRRRLVHLDSLVAKAAAQAQICSVPDGELTWRLLHALRVRELRLEGVDVSDRAVVISRLQTLVPGSDAGRARAVYSALEELCDDYAPSAAVVTEPMLRRHLSGMVIDRSRGSSAPHRDMGTSNSVDNAYGSTVQAGTIAGNIDQHTVVVNVHRERSGRSSALHQSIQQLDLLWRDLEMAKFTGRSELIERVLRFIGSRPRGYVVVRAEAGIGKTALAAHLVEEHHFVYHFTTLVNGRMTAYAFRNLCAQLIRRYGLSDLEDGFDAPSSDAGTFAGFWRVLISALEARTDGRPVVIVIDGMDEFEFPDPAHTSLGLPATLPDDVFVIITSRFGGEARLTDLKTPSEWLTIDVEGDSNISDMRQYLDRVTDAESGDPQLLARLAGGSATSLRDALVTRCAGVWIYLKYVLDEIRDGTRAIDDVERLPGDLATYYAQNIMAWRGDVQDQVATERWRLVTLPLMATLATIREPLRSKEIARLANVELHHSSAFLGATARAFLNRDHVDNETLYSIRHESFRNVLSDGALAMSIPTMSLIVDDLVDALGAANARFVEALVPSGWPARGSWYDSSPYARRHLAYHAVAAGMLDALLVDAGFLTSASAESILVNAEGARTEAGRLAARALFLSLEDWEHAAHDERLGLVNMWAMRLNAREVAVSSSDLLGRRWRISASSADRSGKRRLSKHEPTALDAVRVNGRTLIASGHFDGSVCVFDARTGASIREYSSDEPDFVFVRNVKLFRRSDEAALVVSWTGDSITSSLRAWSVDGGQMLWSVEYEGSVRSMALLDVAGRALIIYFRALAVDDFEGPGELVARDIHTGEKLAGMKVDSNRGRHLSAAEVQGRGICALAGIGIFELDSSFTFAKILDGKQCGLSRGGPLAFDEFADFATLAVSAGNRVEFVDPLTGEMADEPLIVGDEDNAYIGDLWVGRMGNRRVVLVGAHRYNFDGEVETSLWDLASREKLDTSRLWESESIVVAGHHDQGRALAMVGSQFGLQVWEPRTAGALGISDSPTAVHHLGFAQVEDRRVILAGTGEFEVVGRVTMYESDTGEVLKQVVEWPGKSIYAASVWSADDRSFVLAGGPGGARLWDLRTSELLTEVDNGDVGNIEAVEFVPFERGPLAVLVNGEGHIFSYEISSDGSLVPLYEIPGRRPLNGWEAAIGFGSVRGRRAVAVSGDGDIIRMYDLVSAEPMGVPVQGAAGINAIAICEVGTRCLVVSCGSSAEVRCAGPLSGDAEGYLFERPCDDDPLWALAAGRFNDRAMLVAGGASGLMTVWDAVTGKVVETNLRGHREHVYALIMNDSGNIVSSGEDGTLTWWDPAR